MDNKLPYKTTIDADIICNKNFILAGTGLTSSNKPKTIIIKEAITIDNSSLEKLPNSNIANKKDIYIAKPPILGIGLVCTLLSSFGTSIALI